MSEFKLLMTGVLLTGILSAAFAFVLFVLMYYKIRGPIRTLYRLDGEIIQQLSRNKDFQCQENWSLNLSISLFRVLIQEDYVEMFPDDILELGQRNRLCTLMFYGGETDE